MPDSMDIETRSIIASDIYIEQCRNIILELGNVINNKLLSFEPKSVNEILKRKGRK